MLPRAPGQEFARRLATDAHVSRAVLEPLKFLSAADLASVALAGKAWHAASWSPELWADFAQPRSALHPKLWFVFRTLSACCSCRATPASHQVAAVLTPHRVLCTACAPRVCPLLPISFLRKNCPVLLSTSTLPRIVYENTEYTYKSMAERAVRECRQDRMQTAIEVLTELSVLKSGEQLKLMDLGLFRLTVRSAGQFDQFLVDYLLGVEQCGRKKLKRHVAKHYGLTH